MEYVHGGDIYTYGDVLDFSVNVNPYGVFIRTVNADGLERDWQRKKVCRKNISFSEMEQRSCSFLSFLQKNQRKHCFQFRLSQNMNRHFGR